MALAIRPATMADLPELHALIQRAYRGESSRGGWTHEADLLDDERIGMDELAAMVADPRERLLMAADRAPIGTVRVRDEGGGRAYLGLLCVDPARQSGGLGRRLIDAAEACARDRFGASRMTMTVIDRRMELIAYYLRRGYEQTGTCPFPVALDPPLRMVVLEKPLA